MGSTDDILDLSTIKLHLRDFSELLFRNHFHVCLADKLGPDLASSSLVEVWVADGYVNTRLKGGIDVLRAVGGQKQDSLD